MPEETFIKIVCALLFLVMWAMGIFFPKLIEPFIQYIDSTFTLGFLYLTYKTLKQALETEPNPYLDAKFDVKSTLEKAFIQANPELSSDSDIKDLIAEFNSDPPPQKNMVFLSIENLGERDAVEVEAEINYQKIHSLGTKREARSKTVNYGVIKKASHYMYLIETYANPSSPTNEKFILERIQLKYKTLNKSAPSNPKIETNITKLITAPEKDAGVMIEFQNGQKAY